MAEARYRLTYRDPETGADKSVTIKFREYPTAEQMQQKVTAIAQGLNIEPELVSVDELGKKTPPLPTWSAEAKPAGKTLGEKAVEAGANLALYAPLALIGPEAAAGLRGLPAIGEFLARHPQLTAAALRTLGAGPIGAGEAVGRRSLGQEADVWESTKESMYGQLVSEALAPLLMGPIQRGGPRALNKLADQRASWLMTKLKGAVPWFKELPEGHAGLYDVAVSGKGARILMREFGAAIQEIKEALPPEAMTTITIDEARAIKIPIHERIAATGTTPERALVPTAALIDKLPGLYDRDPGLHRSVVQAIDQSLPDLAKPIFQEARQHYREGISAIQALEKADVVDQATHRLNLQRLGMGLVGTPGSRPMAEAAHAPKVSAILREAAPPDVKVPRGGSPGRFYIHPWSGTVGTTVGEEARSARAAMGYMEPHRVWGSMNVPLTGTEQAVRQWTPSVLHGFGREAAQAMGLTPPLLPEGATP